MLAAAQRIETDSTTGTRPRESFTVRSHQPIFRAAAKIMFLLIAIYFPLAKGSEPKLKTGSQRMDPRLVLSALNKKPAGNTPAMIPKLSTKNKIDVKNSSEFG
jgi:hypothetical protein